MRHIQRCLKDQKIWYTHFCLGSMDNFALPTFRGDHRIIPTARRHCDSGELLVAIHIKAVSYSSSLARKVQLQLLYARSTGYKPTKQSYKGKN